MLTSPALRLTLSALQQRPKTWVGFLVLFLTTIALIAYIYLEDQLLSSSSSYLEAIYLSSDLTNLTEGYNFSQI